MAKEAMKRKINNENIENSKSLNKNEIEELVDREAIKFTSLFYSSFYKFHENRIKKEEATILVIIFWDFWMFYKIFL